MDVDESTLCDLLLAWSRDHPEWAIVRVRGEKAQDDRQFFDECSAALQFPYYFGENWDAVWECIIDLGWVPRSHSLVVFDRSERLLQGSDHGFDILMRLLAAASEHLAARVTKTIDGRLLEEPTILRALLACSASDLPSVRCRIAGAEVPFTIL